MKFKWKLLSISLISILSCNPSLGMNYLTKKDNSKPYSWSGYYAGINLGLMNYKLSITDLEYIINGATLSITNNNDFTSGIQFGYRYQLENTPISGVFGIEGSFNWPNMSFKKPFSTNTTVSNSLDNFQTLQGIAGVAVNRILFFFSLGVAYAKLSGDWIYSPSNLYNFSLRQNVFGITYGAGTEYAVTDNLSIFVRVDDVNLNQYTTYDNYNISPFSPACYDIESSFLTSRIGLNIHF